ncbi:MAG: AAA family ATPase [Lachnospiraceae bacterium]
MGKVFNVSADCKPDQHYMVNIDGRLSKIKEMVDRGDYFTINRARQYGKTTTLKALARYLSGGSCPSQRDRDCVTATGYEVLDLDFQKLSYQDFESEASFVKAFSRESLKKDGRRINIPEQIREKLLELSKNTSNGLLLADLFDCFTEWCRESLRPVVLLIDEIDSATNNQVFIDFLGQLRGAYIERDEVPAFQSVILAGVYDIKNLKSKFVREENHKTNSPWNIAADFLVDMSFSVSDIAGMLRMYEADYHTGMDRKEIAALLYEYTSGYPYLVSRICKLLDERIAGSSEFPDKQAAWTKEGVLEAVKILLLEKNPLFDSLIKKLNDYPKLKEMLHSILFLGGSVSYNLDYHIIDMASMLGFIKNDQGNMAIANRIFEMRLYNYFLSEEEIQYRTFSPDMEEKNQFIQNGRLNMKRILEKFVIHWQDVYGSSEEKFVEENGRKLFLLYIKPIINGTGNYYIEAHTRNHRRTDVIIDYRGEQFITEIKIWHGNAYNERGEKQLSDYLDYYHLKKGYMLSFNFNKKKTAGLQEIALGDKILIEAVV